MLAYLRRRVYMECTLVMHLSMLSPRGGGVGHRWGIWFFEQIFNQMPHRRAINIGQMPHHFAINCNKYYVNKSHSVQIAPTRGQNANQNPQGGDAIDDQIPHICQTPPPPPPLRVNIDRCINIWALKSHICNRGYYMAPWRYDFYLRVVKTIFYEQVQRVSKILFLTREDKSHIFKPLCNVYYIVPSKKMDKY